MIRRAGAGGASPPSSYGAGLGLVLLLAFLPAASAAEALSADPAAFGLPAAARVVEARRLPAPARQDRALVLWMLGPSRHERDRTLRYTCPDETRGSYYSGPTRISLVDLVAQRIVNTVEVRDVHLGGRDTFDVPYRIHQGLYDLMAAQEGGGEGQPALLALRDVNGDGRPYELTLFDAPSCLGLATALFGYSDRRDRVLQYPVSLRVDRMGERSARTELWTETLFSARPASAGHWQYEIDYNGRGGCLDVYDVTYVPETESFAGTLTETDCSQ